jgi:hypothetical protein
MLIHAAGVRTVGNYVRRATLRILARPASWRADVLMSSVVFVLLALHVIEISCGPPRSFSRARSRLAHRGPVRGKHLYDARLRRLRAAARLGNDVALIAISGLFTFGWSGSVLVDLVARCQKIRDATNVDARNG